MTVLWGFERWTGLVIDNDPYFHRYWLYVELTGLRDWGHGHVYVHGVRTRPFDS